MSKTDKELAVDVAKAFIEANSVKLAVASNNVKHQTKGASLEEINNVIKSVHEVIQGLPEDKQ